MKKKQIKIQIILVSVGFILFVLTYLYYPSLNKENLFSKQSVKKDSKNSITKGNATTFENLEFKGLYNFDKPFTVQSDEAYILNEEPDLVYMNNMSVTMYLNDGRTITITSDKGKYNKITYDCFFEQNVKATDGNTKIFAENLDLLATQNFVEIYNNVNLDYATGNLKADKIDYNIETKHFKVSMFEEKKVKIKLIQWIIRKNLEL